MRGEPLDISSDGTVLAASDPALHRATIEVLSGGDTAGPAKRRGTG